jgi:hypothetical protein
MLVNSVCMGTALAAMVSMDAVTSGQGIFSAAPFAVVPLAAGALALTFFRALQPLGSNEPGRNHTQGTREEPARAAVVLNRSHAERAPRQRRSA